MLGDDYNELNGESDEEEKIKLQEGDIDLLIVSRFSIIHTQYNSIPGK